MTAYTIFAEDSPTLRVILRPSVEGGPPWINSDLYLVEAKAEGPVESSPLEIGESGTWSSSICSFRRSVMLPAEIPLITGCDAGSPPESLPGGLSYRGGR